MSTALATINTNRPLPPDQLESALHQRERLLMRPFPAKIAQAMAGRYILACLAEVAAKPELQQCTAESVIGCAIEAAKLKIEIGGPMGQSCMVPYKGVAQFQVMYRGLITLVTRSPAVAGVTAGIARDGDVFEVEEGSDPRILHRPVRGSKAPIVAYYASVKFRSGFHAVQVMTPDETDEHRRRFSRQGTAPDGSRKGIWRDHFDAQSLKTAIKKLLKRCPIAIDLPPDPDETPPDLVVDDATPGMLPEAEAPAPRQLETSPPPAEQSSQVERDFETELEFAPTLAALQAVWTDAPKALRVELVAIKDRRKAELTAPAPQQQTPPPPMAGDAIVAAINGLTGELGLTWSQAVETVGLECGLPQRDGLAPKDLTAAQAYELLNKLKAAKALKGGAA